MRMMMATRRSKHPSLIQLPRSDTRCPKDSQNSLSRIRPTQDPIPRGLHRVHRLLPGRRRSSLGYQAGGPGRHSVVLVPAAEHGGGGGGREETVETDVTWSLSRDRRHRCDRRRHELTTALRRRPESDDSDPLTIIEIEMSRPST